MPMPVISFRTKLLAAMMLVVSGVSIVSALVTERKVQANSVRLFEEDAERQKKSFELLQKTRLENARQRCLTVANSVRLRSLFKARVNPAIEKNDQEDLADAAERLYQTGGDELRELIVTKGTLGHTNGEVAYRFLDPKGRPVMPPAARDPGLTNSSASRILHQQLAEAVRAIAPDVSQWVGLLPVEIHDGRQALLEVIITKIVDPISGDLLGALFVGFRMPFLPAPSAALMNGFWASGKLFSQSVQESVQPSIESGLSEALRKATRSRMNLTLNLLGVPHRLFYEAVSQPAGFPQAASVFIYSMADVLKMQRSMRQTILGLGLGGLLVALGISLVLSNDLTVPIRALATGTRQVQQGDFSVQVPVRTRDEIGQLTQSFNEMTHGLAEREKFRNVLNMVADKVVATEMMSGNVALGGETRDVAVLFCDIRGFTALTQNMDPREVIQMLNEHFTPLTQVVHANHGWVDKFVGDLIMGVFGAPKRYGNDAANAAKCAMEMSAIRRKLNQTSKYQIEVGIGVASGKALAGCMGSNDRLNYTVLGERVNLASRLCSKAGRMEVVIDQTTRTQLGDAAKVETLEPLQLKGFSDPVPAYRMIG
jgi:class 3 adenylate cyclase